MAAARSWRAFKANVRLFGKTPAGVEVEAVRLHNAATGMTASILALGAAVQSLTVPLPQHTSSFGKVLDADVVLGFDTLDEYLEKDVYMGRVVGPTAGRVADASLPIDGAVVELESNDTCGSSHLHGGTAGYSAKVWRIEEVSDASVRLVHTAEAGAGGYPSSVEASVVYTLTDESELKIDYDWLNSGGATTVLSPTNHTYFNLSSHHALGNGNGSDDGTEIAAAPMTLECHTMQLMANRVVETHLDGSGVPTGSLVDTRESGALDLRYPRRVTDQIADIAAAQPHWPHGDCHVVDRVARPGQTAYDAVGTFELAAILAARDSNVTMTVHTTAPCIQLYFATLLQAMGGKRGRQYGEHAAICFMAQNFTDVSNVVAQHGGYTHMPEDEAVVVPTWQVAPGERHVQTTAFKFRLGTPAGHGSL